MRKKMKNKKYNMTFSIMVLGICSIFSTLYAQPISEIAHYELIEDLVDSTGYNDDMMLAGNPTPPTPPSMGVELCSNGIYIVNTDGQDIITPIMPRLDINNFEIAVDFKLTQLPDPNALRPRFPIIMGSKFARWLGIYVDSDGIMGFKFNNDGTNYRWSTTAIAGANIWYSSTITYLNGHVDLYLDGQLILSDDIGPLATFQDTFNFTIIDYSEGTELFGCIRNLSISTTDIIFADQFE